MIDCYLAVESTECGHSSLLLLHESWLNDGSATNTKSRHTLGNGLKKQRAFENPVVIEYFSPISWATWMNHSYPDSYTIT